MKTVQKPDRIPCCVPFCNRTGKRLPDDTDETVIICGDHYRLADKKVRRTATLALRRLNAAEKKFNAHQAAGRFDKAREQATLCDRHYKAHCRLFDRIKAQAIERAMGIAA